MRNPLHKKSRYERARAALRDMMKEHQKRQRRREHRHRTKQNVRLRTNEATKRPQRTNDMSGLHWMTAGLFVAAGAEAAFGERRGDYRPDPIRWAPLVAAPLAGAAQAARAVWPSPTTRMIALLVNGVALGVGAAGVASSVSAARRDHDFIDDEKDSLIDRMPSLAPLAFGAVGLLGLLLDSEDFDDEDVEDEDHDPVRRAPKRIVISV